LMVQRKAKEESEKSKQQENKVCKFLKWIDKEKGYTKQNMWLISSQSVVQMNKRFSACRRKNLRCYSY
jgi:glyceraldehyde-3-phosphate dehydrogenase/erythrose-4-phosphate dehydrogenase